MSDQHDRARDHRIRRAVEEAAQDEQERGKQQRNVGVVLGVLALLVVLLLVLIVTGSTQVLTP